MSTALIVIIAGVFLALGSFLFAFLNMGIQAKKTFDGNADQAFSGFGGTFTRHLGAMAGMTIGSLAVIAGIILFFFG